jgi:hypothetical protein
MKGEIKMKGIPESTKNQKRRKERDKNIDRQSNKNRGRKTVYCQTCL